MAEKVIIFSAPSGSGKSTIVNHCLQRCPQMAFSISAASRAPRGQEKDGVDYHFISVDRFKELIARDAFVEWQQVYSGSYYGTLKSEVERLWAEGKVILFDVDVRGAWNLKKYFGNKALSVFVQAPSMEVLRSRLVGRGTDTPEAIRTRLAKAADEIVFSKGKVDYVLMNDDLKKAYDDIDSLVDSFLSR